MAALRQERCSWSGGWSDHTVSETLEFRTHLRAAPREVTLDVIPENRAHLERYLTNVARYGPVATALIVIGILAGIIVPFLRPALSWYGLPLVVVGAPLAVLPFSPGLVANDLINGIRSFGAFRMLWVSRIAGLILLLAGIVLLTR